WILDLAAARRDTGAMRNLILVISALLVPLLATPVVLADPYIDNALVNQLFTELALSDDEDEADQISRRIWTEWFSPNDVRLATRMSVATNLLGEGDPKGSLVELNHVVEEYPDYAEGWNQRATLHFRFGNYEKSLADIEKA